MEILDAGELLGHVVELVIVGSKEHLGTMARVFVQKFGNGPGNRYTVVSAGATANFIQQYQTTVGHIVQNAGGLVHFHHKSGFASGNVIGGTHPGENFIHNADFCLFCGHKATHLGHQHNQGRLTQQRRFSGHVRTGNDNDLLMLIV